MDFYEALVKLRSQWASAKDDDAEAEKGRDCLVKVVMTGSAYDGPDCQPHTLDTPIGYLASRLSRIRQECVGGNEQTDSNEIEGREDDE